MRKMRRNTIHRVGQDIQGYIWDTEKCRGHREKAGEWGCSNPDLLYNTLTIETEDYQG
jgi:hypothetical protein